MIDVYLVRHAFAGHRHATRWPDDAERPLTRRGAVRFRSAARGLRELVPQVDAVYSSPYARTWQTAELLHEEIGWPAAQPCPALAASRSPADALPFLRDLRGPRSVALVGHEPYLSSLASLLVSGDERALRLELMKGALALVAFDDTAAPGTGLLRWSASPRMLRAIDSRASGERPR
jgi:phosphohistidine phosphatase